VLETLFLNLMFAGQLKAMPPKLVSDDGRNVVIRPLVYCAEEELAALSEEKAFPVVPCDLCGSQENLQRKQMKNPRMKSSMLAALGNVRPTHLLDRGLWQRLGLTDLVGTDENVP
jgi:tRNA 2-thiocytidine biosynthesis protein TtcA